MAGSQATVTDDFSFLGEDATQPEGRQALSHGDLLARVSALMQSCEGCENVGVVGVTPLDGPDSAGCNWSFTLVLDTAGVPAEVYGLAYAQVIAIARSSWNLE
jgi:hypothetical protein